MAKVLVIPDVHLKPWMFDRADHILASGQADRVVQLGDLVDDWGQQTNIGKYNQTMARVKKFYEDHPDTLWCLGNHDLGYYHPSMGVREGGHSTLAEADMHEWLVDLEAEGWRQEFLHIIDRVAFSHAGLTSSWVERQKTLTDAPTSLQDKELERLANYASLNELWLEESPIWARPQWGDVEMYDDYLQVVGHTPVMQVEEINGLLSTDTFSTKRDGTPIGSQQFVVVDTKTKEWHLAEEGL